MIPSRIVEGTEPLLGFPLEVPITDRNLAEHAQASGNDFLFTAKDGQTKLSHEIRNWDVSTGRLVAVVKIPSLSPTEDTVIFLYYGNADCASQEDSDGLWSEYQYQQYFRRDPHETFGSSDNIVRCADGTLAYRVFLEAQKQVLEELFGREWLHSDTAASSSHPASTRYRLCQSLLAREGSFRLPTEQDLLQELARLVQDSKAIVQCSGGELQHFSIGSIANYGDSTVQKRIRSEIRSPSKYLDIQTELQWAAWHLGQGHCVKAFETTGPDHRIDIPGWDLPILSDCKRISSKASSSRMRRVIEKANQQIKAVGVPCYGLAVIELPEKVPTYDIHTLSDDFPPELADFRDVAAHSLQTYYRSVTAVVLFWNEISILGSVDQPGRILVTLRSRSVVLKHQCPRHSFSADLDISALQYAGEVSIPITVSPRPMQTSRPGD